MPGCAREGVENDHGFSKEKSDGKRAQRALARRSTHSTNGRTGAVRAVTFFLAQAAEPARLVGFLGFAR
jgi:hypothetical protein